MNKEELRAQLIIDEGRVLHAYKDSLGFWTIGVGRLIDETKGGGITEEESDFLLLNDINKVHNQLTANVDFYKDLDDVRQQVLCNMAFNLGIGGLLEFKNTLHYIKTGNWIAASQNMKQSLWYKQVGIRAERLAYAMQYGEFKK